MARCAYCGTNILFGGKREGDRRFCNNQCLEGGRLLAVCELLPQDMVDEAVLDAHDGPCPRCQGPGPIDVHTSHRVWSMLIMTSSSSRPHICCRRCGIKHQLGGVMFCAVCGWWGFPWGLVFTPIQIVRNMVAIARAPDPRLPSPAFEQLIRLQIAAGLLAARQRAATANPFATAEQPRDK